MAKFGHSEPPSNRKTKGTRAAQKLSLKPPSNNIDKIRMGKSSLCHPQQTLPAMPKSPYKTGHGNVHAVHGFVSRSVLLECSIQCWMVTESAL